MCRSSRWAVVCLLLANVDRGDYLCLGGFDVQVGLLLPYRRILRLALAGLS